MEGCLIPLVIVVAIVVVGAVVSNDQAKSRERARRAYQDSLTKLKGDPTNANLREETLRLGRVYSNITRNKRGVSLFDEVALMNDINAACAGAQRQIVAPKESVESRLSRLADLRTRGVISETEYADRRKRILDDV